MASTIGQSRFSAAQSDSVPQRINLGLSSLLHPSASLMSSGPVRRTMNANVGFPAVAEGHAANAEGVARLLGVLLLADAVTFLVAALSHTGIQISVGFAVLAEPQIIPRDDRRGNQRGPARGGRLRRVRPRNLGVVDRGHRERLRARRRHPRHIRPRGGRRTPDRGERHLSSSHAVLPQRWTTLPFDPHCKGGFGPQAKRVAINNLRRTRTWNRT